MDSPSSTVEYPSTAAYPPNSDAMTTWCLRARRVARRLDIDVEPGSYHGPVKVPLEELERLAERLGR